MQVDIDLTYREISKSVKQHVIPACRMSFTTNMWYSKSNKHPTVSLMLQLRNQPLQPKFLVPGAPATDTSHIGEVMSNLLLKTIKKWSIATNDVKREAFASLNIPQEALQSSSCEFNRAEKIFLHC